MRRLPLLALTLALGAGCGDTWGRESAVEIPLHRDLMEIKTNPKSCSLTESELKVYCNEKNYHKLCPPGCPPWFPRGKQ